jgi:hypothetical protein
MGTKLLTPVKGSREDASCLAASRQMFPPDRKTFAGADLMIDL